MDSCITNDTEPALVPANRFGVALPCRIVRMLRWRKLISELRVRVRGLAAG